MTNIGEEIGIITVAPNEADRPIPIELPAEQPIPVELPELEPAEVGEANDGRYTHA